MIYVYISLFASSYYYLLINKFKIKYMIDGTKIRNEQITYYN